MDRRNTIQKKLVQDAVIQMHRHVTADEVYDYIKCNHPSISKGTVYRNLGVLAQENKIRRVEIPEGPDRYDFTIHKHYHGHCIKCGKVLDVDMDEIKEIESHIREKSEMLIIDYDILFKVICPECQKRVEVINNKK